MATQQELIEAENNLRNLGLLNNQGSLQPNLGLQSNLGLLSAQNPMQASLQNSLTAPGGVFSGNTPGGAFSQMSNNAVNPPPKKRGVGGFFRDAIGLALNPDFVENRQMRELIDSQNISEGKKDLLKLLSRNEQIKYLTGEGKGKPNVERFGVYDPNTKALVDNVLKTNTDAIDSFKQAGYIVGTLRSLAPEIKSNDNVEYFSVTNSQGKRVRTIVNPTAQDISELNKANLFLNKIPTPQDRGTGLDSQKPIEYKGWNDDNGLKTRYFATNTLINTGERLLNQLSENPNSILTVADLAQYFERAKEEVGALGGRPKNYISHLKDNQQSEIKKLAQNAAVSESMLLDFTFQIAQARGQTGRGLSDKDFVIFQKIISAGLTADQKAKALTSFIEGITSEVNEDLTSNYNFYSKRLNRNADDKEAMTFVTGINDLRAMPFRTVVNPFDKPEINSGKRTLEDIMNDSTY